MKYPGTPSHVDATWALEHIGDPCAIDPLLDALRILDYHYSRLAAYALIEIGPSAAKPLRDALEDMTPNDPRRKCAAEALCKIDTIAYMKGKLKHNWAK